MTNPMRRVGEAVACVGSTWEFTPRGEGPLRGPVTVLAIEVAHVLVDFERVREAGTGARRWMSHDAFSAGATPAPTELVPQD